MHSINNPPADEPSGAAKQYFPHVDGLRGIAVLLVVAYHAGLPIPGGFVGVDVFFVISGFIITGLLDRELRANQFSLVNFWHRRIRRILPASAAMLAVTLCISIAVLPPNELTLFSKLALAHCLMIANIALRREVNYFAPAAETNPLLHVWSLAVEEQFYILFPVGLLLIYRFRRSAAVSLIACAAAFSFLASVWLIKGRPTLVFYLLPFRAWELLLGALVSIIPYKIQSPIIRENLAFAGMLAILGASLFFNNSISFPGATAAIPCLGAAAYIAANKHTLTCAGRILSGRAIVSTGLISYSLYLWHWPVFAYLNYASISQSRLVTTAALLSSFILAFASWRFIEQPFRRTHVRGGPLLHDQPRQPKRAFLVAAGVSALLGTASLLIVGSGGLPGRFPKASEGMITDLTWTGAEYRRGELEQRAGSFRHLGRTNGSDALDFCLWGDSHALMLGDAFDASARAHHLRGAIVSTPGRPPLPGVWRPSSAYLKDNTDVILDRIIKARPKYLILAARWNMYSGGYSRHDFKSQVEESKLLTGLIVDSQTEAPNVADANRALAASLARLVAATQRASIQVAILNQVPEQKGDIAKAWYLHQHLGLPFNLEAATLLEHQMRNRHVAEIFSRLPALGVRVIALDGLCVDPDGVVIAIAEGRACYRDSDHLSLFGARKFVLPEINRLLSSFARPSD